MRTGSDQVPKCCPNTVMAFLGGTSPAADAFPCLFLLPYTMGGELGPEEALTYKMGWELMFRALH